MPRKCIQELPCQCVEQPHVRVKSSNQERRRICRWNDRGDGFCATNDKQSAARGKRERTSDKVCAELAFAEVVRADVAVHGTGSNARRADVDGLHGIAGLFEHLDRRTGLGSRDARALRNGGRGEREHYVP